MKTLKFDHTVAQEILAGKKTATWRMYDDKDLSVNDEVKIIDKVDPDSSDSWQIIGEARITQITEKNLGDVTPADMKGHEEFRSRAEMMQTYKNYYGERVDFDTPVRMIYFKFTPSSGERASEAMLLEEAKIYTDGGSRGNPGHSACGYAICNMDDSVVEKAGVYIGIATNNQAEYNGFVRALERAQDLGIDRIMLFSDSQLVVNQMKGLYKVKNQELAPLHQQVVELSRSFKEISFTHIPRELNKIADAMVNETLDAREQGRHSQ